MDNLEEPQLYNPIIYKTSFSYLQDFHKNVLH